jgi:hypothetical protein
VLRRDALIERIRRARRTHELAAEAADVPGATLDQDHLRPLVARVEHLEQMVQGLQDSVHRESSRHDKRIAELEARLQPAALSKALSDDARTRGI